jgi:hypothetical protein
MHKQADPVALHATAEVPMLPLCFPALAGNDIREQYQCSGRVVLLISTKTNQIGRKQLAACKLRLELGGLPDINEPIPPKPKWTRRKTYQRISKEIQALEAKTKTKTRRFRKPIATQLFAYHVA